MKIKKEVDATIADMKIALKAWATCTSMEGKCGQCGMHNIVCGNVTICYDKARLILRDLIEKHEIEL